MTARVDFHFMKCSPLLESILGDEAIRQLYNRHSLSAEINFEDGGRHCWYSDGSRCGEQEQNILALCYPLECHAPKSTPLPGQRQVDEIRQWLHEQVFERVSHELMTPQQRLNAIADILARIAARRAKHQFEETSHEGNGEDEYNTEN
jgi:hypothetical protein